MQGGVFALNIKWNCDFDWGRTIAHCLPKYSFSRLDDANAILAPGWNFRFYFSYVSQINSTRIMTNFWLVCFRSVIYHEENRRTLIQQFGIKVLIEVEGEGRKFDSIKFLLTIGAGLGFLAMVIITN